MGLSTMRRAMSVQYPLNGGTCSKVVKESRPSPCPLIYPSCRIASRAIAAPPLLRRPRRGQEFRKTAGELVRLLAQRIRGFEHLAGGAARVGRGLPQAADVGRDVLCSPGGLLHGARDILGRDALLLDGGRDGGRDVVDLLDGGGDAANDRDRLPRRRLDLTDLARDLAG